MLLHFVIESFITEGLSTRLVVECRPYQSKDGGREIFPPKSESYCQNLKKTSFEQTGLLQTLSKLKGS